MYAVYLGVQTVPLVHKGMCIVAIGSDSELCICPSIVEVSFQKVEE